MSSIREALEAREYDHLAPQAAKSRESKGRLKSEPLDPIRPIFQRDRDQRPGRNLAVHRRRRQ